MSCVTSVCCDYGMTPHLTERYYPIRSIKSTFGRIFRDYLKNSIENSNILRNIDIPWNIGGILGDSPEYWGEPWNTGGISGVVGCPKIQYIGLISVL